MPKDERSMSSVKRRRLLTLFFLLSAALLQAQAPTAAASGSSLKAAAPVPQPPRKASLPVRVVEAARSYRGVPYVSGGTDRSGMDCSGLTFRVYNDVLGMDLPRGVWGLFNQSPPVPYPLHVGDLVFFDTTGGLKPSQPTHVGVYIGENRFIHAASEGRRACVITSVLSDAYYRGNFLGARRVIPWRDPVLVMTLTDSYQFVVQDDPFASREELTLRVFNDMTGGGPMDLRVFQNGARKLSQRISASSQKPAEVRLTPDVGEWTVTVSRLWGGRELERVAFTVVE
jgi:cell wall-associated NlpC family hydrolase